MEVKLPNNPTIRGLVGFFLHETDLHSDLEESTAISSRRNNGRCCFGWIEIRRDISVRKIIGKLLLWYLIGTIGLALRRNRNFMRCFMPGEIMKWTNKRNGKR